MNTNNIITNSDEGIYAVQPSVGEKITSLMTGNTYTLGSSIGEGGFGIVYSGYDAWGNDLAIKVLKPIGTYENVRKNAEDEFNKLLQLRHPNITFVHDAFEYRKTFYIVTERCHSPISKIFELDNFSGISWLMPMARQILQGLHYLHLNNYVHQDIHEGNIFTTFVRDEMIPNKDQVIQFKLGDLGVTKLINDVNVENTRAQWMLPPEVLKPLEFGPIDRRLDIYHFSLILLQFAYSKKLTFSVEEILDGKPREMALQLQTPFSFALEKGLRRHVDYRTADAMELWRDLNTPNDASN
jgi:serine/threonine protein kinase